ncbi:MAG: hypothetical protein V1819_02570 [bacterium]
MKKLIFNYVLSLLPPGVLALFLGVFFMLSQLSCSSTIFYTVCVVVFAFIDFGLFSFVWWVLTIKKKRDINFGIFFSIHLPIFLLAIACIYTILPLVGCGWAGT